MPANRIDEKFSELARSDGRALMPYLTGGYPDTRATGELLRRFDRLGVPIAEVGIPFSDSIADGPVIQGSFHRVLAGGFRVADVFALIESIRDDVSMGLLAMVSMSIVRRIGVREFVERCSRSGFDGLIVPDVPLEEAADVASAATDAGLKHAMLVSPTSPPRRAEDIARLSTGLVYRVAFRGLTGERDELPVELADEVRALRRVSGLPVCVGFGIGTPDQVRAVCRVADGAIVGSALVRRITEGIDAGRGCAEICEAVSAFVEQLLEGTKST